jgi:dipeptidyl-peptidase-3
MNEQAHFATLKCLLLEGDGFLTVECEPSHEKLIIRVDRNRIISHGKPALERMLLKLHIFRCTADVQATRSYFEDLSRVDDKHLEWRRIVLAKSQSKRVFSQANTFINEDEVVLREYPPTSKGVIESWAERAV